MPIKNNSERNPSPIAPEDRLRLIEENVWDYAIFTLTPGGQVASWNVVAERILGFSEEEILGIRT